MGSHGIGSQFKESFSKQKENMPNWPPATERSRCVSALDGSVLGPMRSGAGTNRAVVLFGSSRVVLVLSALFTDLALRDGVFPSSGGNDPVLFFSHPCEAATHVENFRSEL